MKRRKARPTVSGMQGRDMQIAWYKATRRLERQQLALSKAEIARLNGIIARSGAEVTQIKPADLEPHQLPRVRTPGGLPVESGEGSTGVMTANYGDSFTSTELPMRSKFDWT